MRALSAPHVPVPVVQKLIGTCTVIGTCAVIGTFTVIGTCAVLIATAGITSQVNLRTTQLRFLILDLSIIQQSKLFHRIVLPQYS